MLTLTNEMMRQIIMDHYSNPQFKHTPSGNDYLTTHMHSDNCIDDINVYLLIKDNKVEDACFDGIGCTITTASTDIMCGLLIGKSKEEAFRIIDNYLHMIHEEPFEDDVLDEALVFINTSKQAARIRCATIGWNAANKILGR